MKKIISVFIILFLFPIIINAKEKVKVYVFESGGCPYCEMQIEYLKKLDSYNQEFEIVNKELYVDHIDWKEGKDYKLGVKVADEFKKAGFIDASSDGTPFVIISDLYAYCGYQENLASLISKAYEEGDKDAVSCIESGKENCIRENESGVITYGSDEVLDSNSYLKSIELSNGKLSPKFDKSNYNYDIKIYRKLDNIFIKAQCEGNNCEVTGDGNIPIQNGTTKVVLIVKAENGSTSYYTINIEKNEDFLLYALLIGITVLLIILIVIYLIVSKKKHIK